MNTDTFVELDPSAARDGVSSEAVAEIRALKRCHAERERTIEILKADR
jgi:hypothetical protein